MKNLGVIVWMCLLMLSFAQTRAQEEINWIPITDLEAALAQDPKPVLVDVYTNWCGWCKRMDKTTFADADVVAFINANYHAVKLNAEAKETITFKQTDFKFVPSGRRGYNELAAALLQGQMSYPSYVFLNENIEILQVIKGYRTQEEFMPIITFLGKKLYEQQDWQEFMDAWNGD